MVPINQCSSDQIYQCTDTNAEQYCLSRQPQLTKLHKNKKTPDYSRVLLNFVIPTSELKLSLFNMFIYFFYSDWITSIFTRHFLLGDKLAVDSFVPIQRHCRKERRKLDAILKKVYVDFSR